MYVIPANAGIHVWCLWILAFARMTAACSSLNDSNLIESLKEEHNRIEQLNSYAHLPYIFDHMDGRLM